jgi:hypothetical protein
MQLGAHEHMPPLCKRRRGGGTGEVDFVAGPPSGGGRAFQKACFFPGDLCRRAIAARGDNVDYVAKVRALGEHLHASRLIRECCNHPALFPNAANLTEWIVQGRVLRRRMISMSSSTFLGESSRSAEWLRPRAFALRRGSRTAVLIPAVECWRCDSSYGDP